MVLRDLPFDPSTRLELFERRGGIVHDAIDRSRVDEAYVIVLQATRGFLERRIRANEAQEQEQLTIFGWTEAHGNCALHVQNIGGRPQMGQSGAPFWRRAHQSLPASKHSRMRRRA